MTTAARVVATATTVLFYLALTIATTTITTTTAAPIIAGQLYEYFDGAIGDAGGSSWFDTQRWTTIGVLPTLEDTVWIDESNTYVVIDNNNDVAAAEVSELIVGRSAASNSFESVQLDLLEDTILTVRNDMTIGQLGDSDGTVYCEQGASITVGGLLTVGGSTSSSEEGEEGGNGLLILSGSAMVTADDLRVRRDSTNTNDNNNSKIIMDYASTLKIKGDKRSEINEMIGNGSIVIASSSYYDTIANKAKTKTFEVKESSNNVDDNGQQYTYVTIIDAAPSASPSASPSESPSASPSEVPDVQTPAPTSVPTPGPTPAPTPVPTPVPTSVPKPKCKDRKLKYIITKKNGKRKKKNCKWVKKNRKKRCKIQWKNELLSDWCPKACKACPK